MIVEYDASGALLTEYIWVEGRPLAMVADAGTTPVLYYVLTDHLERPVMMTDQDRNVVWQASYLPYGEVRSISGTATLNQRVPAQWFQMETGLAYNWHRHYDPSIRRYLQPDPLGMPDGPSRYAYVGNSPLMKTDPSGQFIQIPPGILKCILDPASCLPSTPPPQYCSPDSDYVPSPGPLNMEGPRGFWPLDTGANEWGRRNGVPPKEARDKAHRIKQKNGGRGAEQFGVNPDTGDVSDPSGDIVGNLDD